MSRPRGEVVAIVQTAADLEKLGADIDAAIEQERKGAAAIEQAGRILTDWRYRIGLLFAEARKAFPPRGPRAKGWGDFVQARGLSLDSAARYIAVAEEVRARPEMALGGQKMIDLYRTLGLNAAPPSERFPAAAAGNVAPPPADPAPPAAPELPPRPFVPVLFGDAADTGEAPRAASPGAVTICLDEEPAPAAPTHPAQAIADQIAAAQGLPDLAPRVELAPPDPAPARALVAEVAAAAPRRTAPLMSSASECWLTPAEIRDLLVAFAGPDEIALDPCSHPRSIVPAAVRYTGPEHGGDDGLAHPWSMAGLPGLTFVNPPYGRALGEWADKIATEARAGAEIIVLCPARVDTAWWGILSGCAGWLAWEGRLTFLEPIEDWQAREERRRAEGKEPRPTPPEAFPGLVETDPAPFPCALIYFGSRWGRFVDTFGEHGRLYTADGSAARAPRGPAAKPGEPYAVEERLALLRAAPAGRDLPDADRPVFAAGLRAWAEELDPAPAAARVEEIAADLLAARAEIEALEERVKVAEAAAATARDEMIMAQTLRDTAGYVADVLDDPDAAPQVRKGSAERLRAAAAAPELTIEREDAPPPAPRAAKRTGRWRPGDGVIVEAKRGKAARAIVCCPDATADGDLGLLLFDGKGKPQRAHTAKPGALRADPEAAPLAEAIDAAIGWLEGCERPQETWIAALRARREE